MVEDFIDSRERRMEQLKNLLKACEMPMLRAGKRKQKKQQIAQVMAVESSPNTTLDAEFDKILPAQVQSMGPQSKPSTPFLDPTLSSSTSSDGEVTIKEEANVSESEPETMLGKIAGIEFRDTVFGTDRQVEATEKFMASLRLWNLRFDANCEDILRRPTE
jgi:hypothetical protein